MSTPTPAWWRVRLRSPVIRMGLGAIVFVLVGLSLNGNPYYLGLYTVGVLTYILAVSLNLLLGYAGLFALAQQALYGVGAYAIVIVGTRVGSLPWIVCLLVAVAVAAIAGLLLALPTARLRGDYLALATLAFAVGFQQLVSNWISVTGGSSGLVDVPTAHLFGHDIEPQTNASGAFNRGRWDDADEGVIVLAQGEIAAGTVWFTPFSLEAGAKDGCAGRR